MIIHGRHRMAGQIRSEAERSTNASSGDSVAKRFTDTDKWKKEWFQDLPLKMKVVWEYLRDNCDHAGIWSPNFKLMSFQLGAEVTHEECIRFLGKERYYPLESGKILLPSFVAFQYGTLNPSNRTHQSVISILTKEGAYKALTSPLQGAKGTDTGTDKGSGTETDTGSESPLHDAERAEFIKAQIREMAMRSRKFSGVA